MKINSKRMERLVRSYEWEEDAEAGRFLRVPLGDVVALRLC